MDMDVCRSSGVVTSVMGTALLNSMLHGSCKLWSNRLINVNYIRDSEAVFMLTYCVRLEWGR